MRKRISVLTMILVLTVAVFAQANPVIRHMGNWDAFDPNTDYVGGAIEEVTGYEVEYSMLPVENANEILSLRISSPGAYDSLKLNPDQYNILTAQGALIPLNDLLEEHGQRILEVISQEAFDAATIDGVIYAVPEVTAAPNVNHVILARKDILDDLGLDVPETVDEFYHALKTIREEKDMLPLALAAHNVDLPIITSGFGMYTAWQDVDGKLVGKVENERYREYLEFMAKLYEENLLDQDFPVNATQQVVERFTSGRAAMMPFAWWQGPAVLPALEANVPGSEWVVIGPLMDEEGNRGIQADSGVNWFIGIPQGGNNPEEVVKWWNSKLELENHKYITIGVEGVHHTEVDGEYYPILPKFEEDLDRGSWYLTGSDEELYPRYWAARARKNPYQSAVYDAIQELRVYSVDNPMAWAPALPTVARYTQSLGVLWTDSITNFIVGGDSLDYFDEFVDAWREAGGEASTIEANEWYQSR